MWEERPQQVWGRTEGLWLGRLYKDPSQVSGGELLLGGLCRKKVLLPPAPQEVSPSVRQRGLGWCLSLRADAKGLVPLAWLPKYQISNEPFLLPLPELERLVKCALYVTSWLRGSPLTSSQFCEEGARETCFPFVVSGSRICEGAIAKRP